MDDFDDIDGNGVKISFHNDLRYKLPEDHYESQFRYFSYLAIFPFIPPPGAVSSVGAAAAPVTRNIYTII